MIVLKGQSGGVVFHSQMDSSALFCKIEIASRLVAGSARANALAAAFVFDEGAQICQVRRSSTVQRSRREASFRDLESAVRKSLIVGFPSKNDPCRS
jgi:hypothetical protein